MARTSPEAGRAGGSGSDDRRRWPSVLAAVGAGMGMGMMVTGAVLPGLAVAIAGCALYGVTWALWRKALTSDESTVTLQAVDAETGLVCPPHLATLLQREIARSQRYGDRLALVVFDVCATCELAGDELDDRPSPAKYVADCLSESARGSDFVARIDETRFLAVLTDADENGAAQFAERTRTKLGTMPFSQTARNKGIYVRVWAGWVRWDPSMSTPAAFVAAATEKLEQTRPGYAGQRSWYREVRAA